MSSEASVTADDYGRLPDGTPVERFTLSDGPLRLTVLTLGATSADLVVPDTTGRVDDVLLGFDDLAGWLTPHPYFGAVVGRVANRIAGGRFTLDGREVVLATNGGRHHLHGGVAGFSTRVWTPTVLDGAAVRLVLNSPDGDEGYPGALRVELVYRVVGREVHQVCTTTNTEPAGGASTVANLTNHAYFNLAGAGSGQVGDHVVEMFGSRYTPSDADLIPTGEIAPTAGTPLDLRTPTRLADRWDADDEQVRNGEGIDHNFLVDDAAPGAVVLAARMCEPRSGRVLEVLTDQPAVQLYTGNHLTGTDVGKGGTAYGLRHGFCLETQHFPDSPNHPGFPSITLRAGETSTSTTVWRFAHLPA